MYKEITLRPMKKRDYLMCPECDRTFKTARGLFWHLVIFHFYSRGHAYHEVGNSIACSNLKS